ncbi:MAG: hypothetical protein U1F57_09840 [bacterium]
MTTTAKNTGACKLGPALSNYDGTKSAVCLPSDRAKTLVDTPKLKGPSSLPKTDGFKEVKGAKFEGKSKSSEFRYIINKNDKDVKFADQIFGASQVRKSYIGAFNQKGELVAVNVFEAKGEVGMHYLQRNQVKMNLQMVELESGKRVFMRPEHAKNFKVISMAQQSQEFVRNRIIKGEMAPL